MDPVHIPVPSSCNCDMSFPMRKQTRRAPSPCVNGDFRPGFWIRGGSRAFARISSRTLGRYVAVTNPAPPRCRSNRFQRISVALQTTPEEPRQQNGPLGAPKRRPDPPQPAPHPPRLVCGGNHGAGTHWLVPILGGCDSHTISNTDGFMV
jgi:hypothetical protein